MNLLMVCLGNICRSPMAEGILQEMIRVNKLDWKVDSAGTEAYHVGEAPHRFSQKVAQGHGIDLSGQRARRFQPSDFMRFDKIYAMAGDVVEEIRAIGGPAADMEKVTLLLEETHPGQQLDVPDPWYGGENGFHEAWTLIHAACAHIIEQYR